MIELNLSIMHHSEELEPLLHELLAPFEAEHRARVQIHVLGWDKAWATLVNVALKGGFDVSQVGSTWVSSLATMDVLRPFTAGEAAALGATGTFFNACWASCYQYRDARLWTVPWVADTRVLYYRRDLVERAGVDPNAAFQTFESLEQTLERLQAAGIRAPFALAMQRDRNALINAAPWVWSAGGHFMGANDRELLFTRPEALAAFTAFYELRRYIQAFEDVHAVDHSWGLYQAGHTAVTLAGPWGAHQHWTQLLDPAVREHARMAPLPGVSFVGGSNLAVWKQVAPEREGAAVELAMYLAGPVVQARIAQIGLLPVRLDVLESAALREQSYHVLTQALKSGRSFTSSPVWGFIEERLATTCSALWREVLAAPDVDVAEAVRRQMTALARRLEITLGSNPSR